MFLEVSSLLLRSPTKQIIAVRLSSVALLMSNGPLGSAQPYATQLHSMAFRKIKQKRQMNAPSDTAGGKVPVEVRLAPI